MDEKMKSKIVNHIENVVNRYLASELEYKFNGKILIVDFSADWCPPCRFMEEFFKDVIKKKYDNYVDIIQIDVEQENGNELYRKHVAPLGVNSIPFLLVFDSTGKCCCSIRGSNTAKLETVVRDLIENNEDEKE